MSRLDPHLELLLSAARFCARPGPASHAELERLTPPAREVYDILPALYQQLVVAAECIAVAPPAAWPLAVDGLSELLSAIGRPTPAETGSQSSPAPITARPVPATVVCPNCGEPSNNHFVCDVCGEAIAAANTGEAA